MKKCILIILFLLTFCYSKISQDVSRIETPVGFISGLDKRSKFDIDNGIIPISCIVQIPNNTKKYIRLGYVHNLDSLTIYPLAEIASNSGRYKMINYTRRCSYSQRSHLILFSYDKEYENIFKSNNNFSQGLAGYFIPNIKGYEILSYDWIGVTNIISY